MELLTLVVANAQLDLQEQTVKLLKLALDLVHPNV
jgi:hypothetical protein